MSDASPLGSASSIRLYSYAMSPYASKVHCFLLFKRLDFECFYIHPMRLKQDLPVGSQIPVLTVDGESRADSTPIGLWLDELFPDAPSLLPDDPDERKRLLAIDAWISSALIPGCFRSYPGEGIDRFRNGWQLSRVMANTARGGLPFYLRAAWPLIIKRVGFVQRLIAQADNGLPVREAKFKLYDEFVAHLAGGPFLAGRDTPSFPDLAAYPQFVLYHVMGFRGGDDIVERPALIEWIHRMTPYLAGRPPVFPEHVRRRALP
jgi:glutathione S-transferase